MRRSKRWALAAAVTLPLALFAGSPAAYADTTYKTGNATYLSWYVGPSGQSLVGGQTSWGGAAPFVGILVIQTLRSSDGAIVSTNSTGNGGTLIHPRTTGTSRCRWEAITEVQSGTQSPITCRSHT
jgi:hypothetical protein